MNCSTGTLAPYVPSIAKPWDKKRVQHLYRRLGFGINADDLTAILSQSPTDIVDDLITEAAQLPLPEAPFWANYTVSDYSSNEDYFTQSIAWTVQWVKDMLQYGFREKLALFWHNHFVTELDTYRCPSWQYQYHKLLQQYALGNFKDFVYEMGKTPAMLVYLNGVQNTRFEPNENYARELYELFTLGRDNGYTQQDIEETAKALTGWNNLQEICAPINFTRALFDNSSKTIFGRTGNWGYDEVHDILFEERGTAIAKYICTKLYKYFVSPTVDEAIVDELAITFKNNDFEISPVLLQLFKSEHFFDDTLIGVKVRSPLEYLLTIVKEWDIQILSDETYQRIIFLATQLGQRLFNPVDVAGWQGNRTWINSNSLSTRWDYANLLAYNTFLEEPNTLVQLAKSLTTVQSDPDEITKVITDFVLPNGFPNTTAYDRATTIFKSEVPENYYEDGSWNLDWESAPAQVALLLNHLLKQPEFQLM